MLDRESQLSAERAKDRKIGRSKRSQATDVKVQMLTYLAQEDRNRSAARALDAYYNLGEAEANADILQLSLAQVTAALATARALKVKGLPADDTALHRQQLDLQVRGARLQVHTQHLNSELRTLLDFEPCPPNWQFSPVDAFQVPVDILDPDQAVAFGLDRRPELLLLRLLEEELCAGNLETISKQLHVLNAALNQMPAAHCPHLQQLLAQLCGLSKTELEVRQQQVSEYRASRERAVAEEIRQAVQTVQGQTEVVALTVQRADSWRSRVREAEEKEAKGTDSFVQTTEAKVEWYKARQDVVSEIIRLQRARVQVRQAQGVLPSECYHVESPLCKVAACHSG